MSRQLGVMAMEEEGEPSKECQKENPIYAAENYLQSRKRLTVGIDTHQRWMELAGKLVVMTMYLARMFINAAGSRQLQTQLYR